MTQWIRFVAEERLADAAFDRRIECLNISDGSVGVAQPILHRPKTFA